MYVLQAPFAAISFRFTTQGHVFQQDFRAADAGCYARTALAGQEPDIRAPKRAPRLPSRDASVACRTVQSVQHPTLP